MKISSVFTYEFHPEYTQEQEVRQDENRCVLQHFFDYGVKIVLWIISYSIQAFNQLASIVRRKQDAQQVVAAAHSGSSLARVYWNKNAL